MTKRITVATITGLLTGLICWQFAASGGNVIPLILAVSIILSRTLTGFAIGISALKLAWWLHGAFLGGLFSIPMALGVLMTPGPQQKMIAVSTVVMGIIYGFLVELSATVIFKAPVKK
ncbi:MAG: hypothetical protein KKH98_03525 [Spirochaetes bacterium]|nr:hypothetical protein [Spirochaetota bacterium]